MRFAPSEDQAALLQGVRKLAHGHLRAQAAGHDRDNGLSRATIGQLRALGAFGLLAGEEAGGLGADAATFGLAIAELAMADAGLALAIADHNLAAAALSPHGELAEKLAAGEQLACLALAGPSAHPDESPVPCQLQGDRLQGHAAWSPLAALADVGVVAADDGGSVRWFAVALAQSGVQRTAMPSQTGLRSASGSELHFAGAEASHLAGDAHQKSAAIAAWRALSVAFVALGSGRGAARAAGKYADERQQFGAPISRLQPVQWHVANSAVELEAASGLCMRAALALAGEGPCGAAPGERTQCAIWQAKLAATSASAAAADRAIQVHGGYGYTKEFHVERHYRDAAMLQWMQGSPARLKVLTARYLAANAA